MPNVSRGQSENMLAATSRIDHAPYSSVFSHPGTTARSNIIIFRRNNDVPNSAPTDSTTSASNYPPLPRNRQSSHWFTRISNRLLLGPPRTVDGIPWPPSAFSQEFTNGYPPFALERLNPDLHCGGELYSEVVEAFYERLSLAFPDIALPQRTRFERLGVPFPNTGPLVGCLVSEIVDLVDQRYNRDQQTDSNRPSPASTAPAANTNSVDPDPLRDIEGEVGLTIILLPANSPWLPTETSRVPLPETTSFLILTCLISCHFTTDRPFPIWATSGSASSRTNRRSRTIAFMEESRAEWARQDQLLRQQAAEMTRIRQRRMRDNASNSLHWVPEVSAIPSEFDDFREQSNAMRSNFLSTNDFWASVAEPSSQLYQPSGTQLYQPAHARRRRLAPSASSMRPQSQVASPHQAQQREPEMHQVYLLSCKSCGNLLSDRGMKAVLLLKPHVTLYSTDIMPNNCGPLYPNQPAGSSSSSLLSGSSATPTVERTCDCLTDTLGCYGCGSQIGYHIVSPCMRCTASVSELQRGSNGHRTVLHCSEIDARERRYVPGEAGVMCAPPTPPPSPPPMPAAPGALNSAVAGMPAIRESGQSREARHAVLERVMGLNEYRRRPLNGPTPGEETSTLRRPIRFTTYEESLGPLHSVASDFHFQSQSEDDEDSNMAVDGDKTDSSASMITATVQVTTSTETNIPLSPLANSQTTVHQPRRSSHIHNHNRRHDHNSRQEEEDTFRSDLWNFQPRVTDESNGRSQMIRRIDANYRINHGPASTSTTQQGGEMPRSGRSNIPSTSTSTTMTTPSSTRIRSDGPRRIERGEVIYWSDLVSGGERVRPLDTEMLLRMPVAGR